MAIVRELPRLYCSWAITFFPKTILISHDITIALEGRQRGRREADCWGSMDRWFCCLDRQLPGGIGTLLYGR